MTYPLTPQHATELANAYALADPNNRAELHKASLAMQEFLDEWADANA